MKPGLLIPFLLLCLAPVQADEEKPKGIPYNSVNRSMALLKGVKFDGVECVPFYVRTAEGRPPLVPAEADFKIMTWEGATVKLACEPVERIAEADRPEIHGKMVEEGYTHVLWMPKGVKRYLDGAVQHSLPKGTVNMSQAVSLAGGRKQPKQ